MESGTSIHFLQRHYVTTSKQQYQVPLSIPSAEAPRDYQQTTVELGSAIHSFSKGTTWPPANNSGIRYFHPFLLQRHYVTTSKQQQNQVLPSIPSAKALRDETTVESRTSIHFFCKGTICQLTLQEVLLLFAAATRIPLKCAPNMSRLYEHLKLALGTTLSGNFFDPIVVDSMFHDMYIVATDHFSPPIYPVLED